MKKNIHTMNEKHKNLIILVICIAVIVIMIVAIIMMFIG